MHLDVQTLSVVTVFITALLGALLVFAGLQNRSIRAPMWWGAAHIVNASGLGLLTSRGAAPDFVTIDVANALVLLGYSLTWTGARVFDSRSIGPFRVLFMPRDLDGALPPPGLRRRRQSARRHRLDDAGAACITDGRRVLARTRRAADVTLAVGHRAARLCRGAARARAGHSADADSRRRLPDERLVIRVACIRHVVVHGCHGFPAAQYDEGAHRAQT